MTHNPRHPNIGVSKTTSSSNRQPGFEVANTRSSGFVEKSPNVQSTQSANLPPSRPQSGPHGRKGWESESPPVASPYWPQNQNEKNKNTKADNKVDWSQNDDFESDNVNQTPWKSSTDAEKVDDYVGKNYTTTWTGPDDSFIYDPSKNAYHVEENEEDGFIDIGSLPFDDDKTYNQIADEQDGLIDWWHDEKDKGLSGLGATLFGKSNINHANPALASTHSIATEIQKLNPEWTWHEVLNFMEGDYHADGRVGVLGKHIGADGNALSIPNKRGDRHKSINPDTWALLGTDSGGKTKNYNTFGGGLRGNWEMNIGELTDRGNYTSTLDLLAANVDPSNKDLYQAHRAVVDRVKFFNPSHGKSGLAKVFLGALAGFGGIPGMLATQVINSKSTAEGNREALEQKWAEKLAAPFTAYFEQMGIGENGIESIFSSSGGVIINDKTRLAGKYDLMQHHFDDVNSNADTPANRHSVYNTAEYSPEEAVSPETQYGGWIGRDEALMYTTDFIDSDGDGIDDRWQSGPGEPSQQPGSAQGTSTASTNNPAWMDFGGGFERLFTAKEGGVVNKYQTGGFVRKPQVISDPTAAPASQRADDVNLQAETGDFIMGYPAMQQSGTRVRSLVEQAMLKAKDAGVKTKGYKKGDKVDILVHNGEMQIPQELVPYIGGGYATLKKLNAPSKHQEGDVVGDKTISDANINRRTFSDNDFQNQMANLNDAVMTISPPTISGGILYDRKNVRELPSVKRHGLYSEQLWKKFLNKLIKSTPSNPTVQRETALKVKEAVEKSTKSVNPKLLLNNEFIKNANAATEFHYLMNEVNKMMEKKPVQYKVELLKDGLVFDYPNGTPALTGKNKPLKTYKDFFSPINLEYTSDEPLSSLAKQVLQSKKMNYGIDDISTDMTGNTGQHSRQAYKAEFPAEYGKLFKFLKDVESSRGKPNSSIYSDVGKPAIGYGHRLSSDELKAYNGMPGERSVPNWTKEDSEYMLGKDILEAEHLARSIYNSKTGSKFSDLDENRKMMLTEMAFNMGNKLKGFPKFMDAVKNEDYNTMSSEYHRTAKDENGNELKGIETRNKEFFRRFLSPYLFGGTEGVGGRL